MLGGIFSKLLHVILTLLNIANDTTLLFNIWIALPSQTEDFERVSLTPVTTTLLYAVAEPVFTALLGWLHVNPSLLLVLLVVTFLSWAMISMLHVGMVMNVSKPSEGKPVENDDEDGSGESEDDQSSDDVAKSQPKEPRPPPGPWPDTTRRKVLVASLAIALAFAASTDATLLVFAQSAASTDQSGLVILLKYVVSSVCFCVYPSGTLSDQFDKRPRFTSWGASFPWQVLTLQFVVKLGVRWVLGVDPFVAFRFFATETPAGSVDGSLQSGTWAGRFGMTMGFMFLFMAVEGSSSWWLWRRALGDGPPRLEREVGEKSTEGVEKSVSQASGAGRANDVRRRN